MTNKPATINKAPIEIRKVMAFFNSHQANKMAMITLPLSISATVATVADFEGFVVKNLRTRSGDRRKCQPNVIVFLQ
jgi:hypothetical protein